MTSLVKNSTSLKVMKNVGISMLVMFLTGAIYDLGVYNLAVDRALGSSDATWSSSMAYMSPTGTLTMLLSGVILSSHQTAASSSSQTYTLRLLCLFAALSYLLLCVGAYAIKEQSPFLISLAFASLGNGFGVSSDVLSFSMLYSCVADYLVGVELAAAWLPRHAGLAIGFCQMSFGLGSIVFTEIFSRLQNSINIEAAIFVTSAILSTPGLATCMLVEWPQESLSLPRTSPDSDSEDNALNRQEAADGRPISWKLLPKLPLFWLYVVTISAAQAGYMFIPYFFDIGHSFNESMIVTVRCFQAINLLGTAFRPLVGSVCDALKRPSGPFFIGTKNFAICLLALQLVMFIALIPISHMGWFGAFAICSGLTVILFAAAACLSALLARELFGRNNSALIFGVGGSVAMGSGEFFAVYAMEQLASRTVSGPAAYNSYYYFAIVWTIVGLVASLFLCKSSDAFPRRNAIVIDDYGSAKLVHGGRADL
ncbi:MFS transporter [Gracilaria domingensis]|nr:MFS transporter [Gracilaria domingensis]